MDKDIKTIIRAYYETNKINLKDLAKKFNVSYNTVKSWKNRDKKDGVPWLQPGENKNLKVAKKDAKKVAEPKNKKQAIKQAKTIVVSGGSLEEASKKTKIPIGTLAGYSTKEKWLESQKEFNEFFYKEMRKAQGLEQLKRNIESIKWFDAINKIIMKRIIEQSDTLNPKELKELSQALNENIKTQTKLIGIKEIDKIEFEEFNINDDEDNKITIEVLK